jgi:hypothetical protein
MDANAEVYVAAETEMEMGADEELGWGNGG